MVSSRMTNNGPKSLKRSATPEDRPHSQRVRARSSSITSEPTNPDPKIKREEQDKKEEESIQDKSKKTDEENDKLPIDLTAFDKAAARIEREGEISFRVVQNDGSDDSHIVLTGLKNVFMKQLPKMPREYITRLVFDRSHQSMAIIKSNPAMSIVGGITFRPFSDRGFAEIVFCAVASSEQVQGFGAHLMNHLKDYIAGTSPIRHFLTYADNYAIGYFKKQGFTKDITLDKSIWTGYIKDYEGGTLMQGTILPSIRYVYGAATLALQKAAILKIIKENTRSNIVYPGISAFKRSNKPIKPEDVPGLKEGGWSPEMNALAEKPKRKPFHSVLQMILTEMQNHPSSWPFLQPVSKEDVPDYYKVIKYPMDLSAMEEKLENNCYETFEQFINDCYLIFDNCRSYNDESTTYYKNATKLEKFLKQQLKDTEYHHLIPN